MTWRALCLAAFVGLILTPATSGAQSWRQAIQGPDKLFDALNPGEPPTLYFQQDATGARHGVVLVLAFHTLPDRHPWVYRGLTDTLVRAGWSVAIAWQPADTDQAALARRLPPLLKTLAQTNSGPTDLLWLDPPESVLGAWLDAQEARSHLLVYTDRTNTAPPADSKTLWVPRPPSMMLYTGAEEPPSWLLRRYRLARTAGRDTLWIDWRGILPEPASGNPIAHRIAGWLRQHFAPER
jgi:hypothetical protein